MCSDRLEEIRELEMLWNRKKRGMQRVDSKKPSSGKKML